MKLSEMKSIFNLKICFILLLSCILCLWGVYKFTFTYITHAAIDDVQSVLLGHKGIHRYVQGVLIPSYLKAQEEGHIDKDWYTPIMLSSSYIIRNQHDFYNEEREKVGLPSIYYKLAALNPRNPLNQADDYEKELIEMFRNNPDLTREVHVYVDNGQRYYHVAIPFLRNNNQCLLCHGKRENSPPDLQELYPGEGGFNENVGDLRAITALKVPIGHDNLMLFVVLIVSGIMMLLVSILILFNLNMRKLVDKEVKAHEAATAEKQQLQTRLNQAQKMEAIGTLAGGIAHDFNNILSVILGYSELLKKDLRDKSNQESIDQVLKATNRAAQLVKQILCFSRQSEGEILPLKIGPHVKEIIKMLRASIPSTINFKIDFMDVDSNIFADPSHIHQIVTNICTNAYHAMQQKGGTLTVSLRRVELGVENLTKHPDVQPGKFMQLSINDTGCGIPKDALDLVFEPYFTTKPVGEGTGMGLSIVHGLVENYGGYIFVYSEEGVGTTFNVFLPLFEGETKILNGSNGFVCPGGEEHILVVDDEESLADLNYQILMGLGYRVTTKTDPQEALSLFCEAPDTFDLVLTDQTMPKITGFDMANKMLEIRPSIPIILCSGYNSVVNEEQALAAGIKAFVLKPLTIVKIAQLIREVLPKASKITT